MDTDNNWGVISGKSNLLIHGGETKNNAENIAKAYSCEYGIPFGYVEHTDNLEFKMENVRWICETLFDEWNVILKTNPYTRFTKHKDLIAICCCDIDEDEIICVMEKKECKRLAKLICGIEDFDNWIKNEYTSDQSEIIISTAVKNGKVLTVYK